MAVKEIWVFAVLVILAIWSFGGNLPFLGSVGGGPGGDGNIIDFVVTPSERACGSTTMTMNFDVKYKSGTDLTGQNGTVFINGNEKGTFNEGATFTAQGGDLLRNYPVLDIAGTDYLGGHYEGNIPCTGQTAAFLTSAGFMKQMSGSSLLDNPGRVYEADSAASTETIINDDFSLNTGAAPQSISAGDTRVMTVKMFPVFEEGYGIADGSTLACRFTDSQIDQSETDVSYQGQVLPPAKYVPTVTLFAVTSTNQSTKFWAMPPITGKATTTFDVELRIKGDDNNEPTTATNFSCETFGTDYYKSDEGPVVIDVEDRDDNVKIGRTVANEFAFNIALS